MKVVVQRVRDAGVKVNGEVVGAIARGLLVLVGFESEDDATDIQWMTNKLVQMRIFGDENGKMNRSLLEVKGDVLVVSQFTLHASTKKGNRPSFIKAARPEVAIPLYEEFKKCLNTAGVNRVASGVFGANMKVSLLNDGPVTIILDSKNKI